MKKCIALLAFLFLALPLRAETVDSVENPLRTHRSWVSDMAQMIDDDSELQINRTIEDLERRTSAEIAVVTVQNTKGDTPKEFATALFNRWGVGKKGKDNGVLVLLVQETRHYAVEIGYGVEGEIPDSRAGELMREKAVPRFKQGEFGGGLLAVVQEFAAILSGGAVSTAGAPKSVSPATTAPRHTTSRPTASRPSRVPVVPHSAPPISAPPANYSPSYSPVSSAPTASSGPFDVLFGLLILMMLPVGGGVVIWAILALVKKANTRYCPQCKREMRYLNEVEDDTFLDEAQLLEEQLGGLDWRVWRCDACGIQHLERSVKWLGGYEDCPRCGHHTVQVSSSTLRHPTYYSEGLRETTHVCHFPNCNYTTRTQQIIPRREQTVVVAGSGYSSSSDSGWSGSSSSSSSSSSSDSGFSSSSSDFGGGSSGGGGVEGSW